MPPERGEHVAEGRLGLFAIPGGSPACSLHVLLRSSVHKVPEHYDGEANGVPLYQWANDFVNPPGNRSVWIDNVEDFALAPPLP